MSPEIQVKAITLTHGNVGLDYISRNAVSLLHVMSEYQKFAGIQQEPDLPVLAVGASKPLQIEQINAGEVHGKDGLGEIYEVGWLARSPLLNRIYGKQLFDGPADWEDQLLHKPETETDVGKTFRTTSRDAADEILFQLKEAPPLTISICAVGPLTNIALAYQRDPVVFSRAKRIVIMGGAIHQAGNVTPMAEFNFRADPHAADLVMTASKGFENTEKGYQRRLELLQRGKQAPCHIVILPLDAGDDGCVSREDYLKHIVPLKRANPLTSFCNTFLVWFFNRCCTLFETDTLAIYDAYTILLLIDMVMDEGNGSSEEFNKLWYYEYLDLHVETGGVYTQGMCCYDRRLGPKTSTWGEPNCVQVMLRGNGKRFNRILLNRVFNANITEENGFNMIYKH
ncbi:hypothetical protein EC973_007774 [Apophysomyces ossiformis]|uniref:Inosine/uridine-preferring nucleoside hydrolase domain-containing protein n=1 Tax=Apophysomyces ossiformis TaxID=679940 RepID=A0A8H7BXN6_9FUNG|nr:hypothetical protein EC973_007774 [Apophysomyces ossiformis]